MSHKVGTGVAHVVWSDIKCRGQRLRRNVSSFWLGMTKCLLAAARDALMQIHSSINHRCKLQRSFLSRTSSSWHRSRWSKAWIPKRTSSSPSHRGTSPSYSSSRPMSCQMLSSTSSLNRPSRWMGWGAAEPGGAWPLAMRPVSWRQRSL